MIMQKCRGEFFGVLFGTILAFFSAIVPFISQKFRQITQTDQENFEHETAHFEITLGNKTNLPVMAKLEKASGSGEVLMITIAPHKSVEVANSMEDSMKDTDIRITYVLGDGSQKQCPILKLSSSVLFELVPFNLDTHCNVRERVS